MRFKNMECMVRKLTNKAFRGNVYYLYNVQELHNGKNEKMCKVYE